MLIDKKVTRKEFLLSILSIGALLFVNKLPSVVKSLPTKNGGNSYGNHSYGGKNNA